MGKPLLLTENLLNRFQFPDHTISAEEEPTGFEAAKVANGRRAADDYASATTANSAWWIQSIFDRLRAFNFVALDRASNLLGTAPSLLLSYDSFATSATILDAVTIPSTTAPGRPDDDRGVVTEEGAWLKRFPLEAARGVRLSVPALGAGVVPQIVGLYVGLALEVDYFEMPLDDDADELIEETLEGGTGWLGGSDRNLRRGGRVSWGLNSFSEYDEVRYHLSHFRAGHPMWLVFDQDEGQRAALVRRRPGSAVEAGFSRSDRGWRGVTLDVVELGPRRTI